MKRLATLIVLFVAFAMASMADTFDYVYLNNGNVVKGIVEQNDNTKVTIRDTNGNLLTYTPLEVNRVVLNKDPKVPSTTGTSAAHSYRDFSEYNHGFWWGLDLSGGVSLREHVRNIQFIELDAVAGYRFNDFFRIGVGAGVRNYPGYQYSLRCRTTHFSYPLFATIRGNLILSDYRTVVPYWSVDCGGAVQDGFMLRPTIGMRIGSQTRHSFILGLSYLHQRLLTGYEENAAGNMVKVHKYIPFISLRLGYEF